MAAIRPAPVCINGHWWRDVTNETTGGSVYNARDVIACGGQIPWVVSFHSEYYLPTPAPVRKNRLQRRTERAKNR